MQCYKLDVKELFKGKNTCQDNVYILFYIYIRCYFAVILIMIIKDILKRVGKYLTKTSENTNGSKVIWLFSSAIIGYSINSLQS
jgi:hypothetical protein